MEKDNFSATHVGEICFLCEKPIELGDEVRYYGGPYIVHAVCLYKLIEDHS